MNVFYPMGWDDNGLPTERRVQNLYGVRCSPVLPYRGDEELEPPRGALSRDISRRAFIELCRRVTAEDEEAFKHLWTRLGLSVDWRREYSTIDDRCRRVAQDAFLRLLDAGVAYTSEAPVMWDTGFGTAVAQAEVEDRLTPGALHHVAFGLRAGGTLTVATTRPELLPACVAVAVHPDDERHRHLVGGTAVTPLFLVPVPVFASGRVEPDRGTGAVMVCTFGDATDVEWWREEGLPLRQVLGRDGRFTPVDFATTPASLDPEGASAAHAALLGRTVPAARRAIVEMLRSPDSAPDPSVPAALLGAPTRVEHAVKYYEKGDEPLEFLPTRQWFVRLLDRTQELSEAGANVRWIPDFAGARFQDWTTHLRYDWCISRQRYFGVPIPVWYAVDDHGATDHDRPLTPDAGQLPVDPMTDVPPGHSEEQRDRPRGFTGEADVFDTWMTSSLTPQITSGWPDDPGQHARLFPFDVRAQSHEIIRTWAFYTIAQASLHESSIPWRNALISGWVRDPDRKKMSKSLGNVITPESWLDRYSADAVRYWAASARLGTDTTFDEAVLKEGGRLVVKLFNAARFVHMRADDIGTVTFELDRAFAADLGGACARSTEALETFDHATALEEAERFFRDGFTDNWLELVKVRLREGGEGARSAAAAAGFALRVFLRLFAPFLPYVTEEIWSWRAAADLDQPSIHRAPWPAPADFQGIDAPADPGSFASAVTAIRAVRRHKTAANVSVGEPMERVELAGSPEEITRLGRVADDVRGAARAATLTLTPEPGIPRVEIRVLRADRARPTGGESQNTIGAPRPVPRD
jgi:valyl-tRNA synthetase